MESTPVTRRLAAIVIADVVGYTRLMERDDTGTFARLRAIRDEVIEPVIASHDGRIVKTAGDGLLAEFPSALAALGASLQIQREMTARNAGIAAEGRIDYRIGVNLGDIMVDGSDIVGDGVNVASRLESLAEPGGVCVSGSVREQVHGQMPVTFVDIGEQQVKNIERPIRVYHVASEGQPKARVKRAQSKRWLWITTTLAGAVLIGAVTWWTLPVAVKSPSASSAPAMSIAILPFTTIGEASAQFAETLTRDLGTGLARGSQAVVVASHEAAARYKGNPIDERTVGRDLNVRYLAEGEVRSAGERKVVSIQLIDVGNASQAWSGRFEFGGAGPDSDETAFSRRLTSRVRGALFSAEARRAAAGGTPGTGARDLVWRAMGIDSAGTLNSTREAGKLLDEALRLEPTLLPALTNRALTLVNETELDPRADYARLTQQADDLSSRAVSIDNDDAFAWMTRGIVLGYEGRVDQALAANALAQRLDPTRQRPTAWHAWLKLISGEPNKALATLAEARAVFPDESALELRIACWANLNLGRYDSAIALCEKAAGMDTWYFDHVLLAAAYANKSEATKAAAKAELDKRLPGYTISILKSKGYSSQPNYGQQAETHLYPGLRKAGIPEE
jgi:class 3 adenylate cyclase/TolB-like protein